MKYFGRFLALTVGLGALFFAVRAAMAGHSIPIALSAVLVLCAAVLIVYSEREFREAGR